MKEEKSQNNTTKDLKQQGTKGKKLEDFSGEELDKMDPEASGKLFADAIVENLNDPANHDKSL